MSWGGFRLPKSAASSAIRVFSAASWTQFKILTNTIASIKPLPFPALISSAPALHLDGFPAPAQITLVSNRQLRPRMIEA